MGVWGPGWGPDRGPRAARWIGECSNDPRDCRPLISGVSLQRTRRLLPAVLGIQLVGLVVLAYCLAAFFSSITYGYVSRNWDTVKRRSKANEDSICINALGQRWVPSTVKGNNHSRDAVGRGAEVCVMCS